MITEDNARSKHDSHVGSPELSLVFIVLMTFPLSETVERQNIRQIHEDASRISSPVKDGFFPGPITLARYVTDDILVEPMVSLPLNSFSARSSAIPDTTPFGRSQSPVKRAPSPHKMLTIPSRVISSSSSQGGANGALKANGRKRLFMDPREDDGGKTQAGAESNQEEHSTAFSLPKRQRVNTWGTDSQHIVGFL